MEYRIIRSEQSNDYFEHALFGGGRQKGAQNKNHKYLARAWIQNKWRYAYTQAEVRALENWGKQGSLKDKQKLASLKRESKDAKKAADKAEKQIKKDVSKTVNNVADRAKGTANVLSGRAKQTVDNVSNVVEKTAYNAKKSATKAVKETTAKARELVSDVKSGVTQKQVAIKAQTAVNDAKNLANKAPSTIKSAADKGRNKVSEIFNKASDATKSVADKATSAVKSEITKDIELAKNAAQEREFTKYGENSVKNAQKKLDKIDKELADYEKEASKDAKFKEANRGWLAEKQRQRSEAEKQLKEAKEWKKEWEDSDKTLYRETDKASDMNPNMRELEGVTSTQRKQEIRGDEKTAAEKAIDSVKSATEKGKNKVEELFGKAKDTGKNVADKATDQIEKVRESDAMAYANKAVEKATSTAKSAAEKVANSSVGQKVSDAVEVARDKVDDIKAKAEHKQYANEMKRKYGADSLHYKDAQAYVEHDKTVDELQKARDKYGVNSAEYRAAAAKEQKARDAMDDVHEQNLYTNNAQYKKISDQASALGSYINNMDARGGPQTAEGKANYQKAVQDLKQLEAKLERMWNEDWE